MIFSAPLLDRLQECWQAGESAALATVVSALRSTPFPVGTSMLVTASGAVHGSVSGGCVEADLYEHCRTVIEDGIPRNLTYGITDEDGFAAGLPCGGTIEVRVERIDRAQFPDFGQVAAKFDQDTARLLVFGAGPVADALAVIGTTIGFSVTICDARPVFATTATVVDWPDRYLAAEADAGRLTATTAVAVLTHDPKFDIPLLELALRLPVGYVGAMGSRRTLAHRLARLREAGLTEAELARLHSPIGLAIGGSAPAEIAVSIAAELVATRHGGRARSNLPE